MAFSTFTMLYNHHFCVVPNTCVVPGTGLRYLVLPPQKEIPHPFIPAVTCHFPLPPAPGICQSAFCLYGFVCHKCVIKWIHTVYRVGQKEIYSCEFVTLSVLYFFINDYIISHRNCKPTFAPPYITFCVWHLSLSIMLSRIIPTVTSTSISFLFMVE